jgi:hypothetical protein
MDLAPGDAAFLGAADDGVRELAELLGWGAELAELVSQGHAAIDADAAKGSGAKGGRLG